MPDEKRNPLGLSDVVLQTLINTVMASIVTCVLAYMANRNKEAVDANKEQSAVQHEEVKKELTGIKDAAKETVVEVRENTAAASRTTEEVKKIPEAAKEAASVAAEKAGEKVIEKTVKSPENQ